MPKLETARTAFGSSRHWHGTSVATMLDNYLKSKWIAADIHAARPVADGGTGEWRQKYMSELMECDQCKTYQGLYKKFCSVAKGAATEHGFRNRGCHPMVGIAIARKRTH